MQEFRLGAAPLQMQMSHIDADLRGGTDLHPNVHVRVLASAHLDDGQTGLQVRHALAHFRHIDVQLIANLSRWGQVSQVEQIVRTVLLTVCYVNRLMKNI